MFLKRATGILIFFFSVSLAAATDEVRPGALVPQVSVGSDPTQTYAVYLPSSYTAQRRWPLLLVFDPRARGERAAGVFVPAAERFGWIVAASNNARGDGPTFEENRRVVTALLGDVVPRYAVDANRIYASGFSAGARIAIDLALNARVPLAGVIAVGAGYPFGLKPTTEGAFPLFAFAGERDFNYYEMRLLDRELERLGTPHRLRIFAGGHEWPPSSAGAEALEWMELQAMRARKRPADEQLVSEAFLRRTEVAAAAAAAGDLPGAYLEYAAMAEDFATLTDAAKLAQTGAERLGALREVRKEIARADERDDDDRAWVAQAQQRLADALSPANTRPPSARNLMASLEISALRQEAKRPSREESLSALRKLEGLFVQASSYAFPALARARDYARAILALSVAAAIKPENPIVQYNLASMYSLTGDQGPALDALERAVKNGFSDRELLRSDTDLDAIRKTERFKRIEESIH